MKLGNDGALKGRLLAAVILAAVSGASFTLGYLVGRVSPASVVEGRDAAATFEEPAEIVAESIPREMPKVVVERPAAHEGVVNAPATPVSSAKPETPAAAKKDPVDKKEAAATPETPEVKKTAEPAKSAPKEGYYSVQAGVFEDKKHAESLVAKLKGKGYTAYIDDSGKSFKVKVGRLATKDEAAALAAKLKKTQGIKGFVVGPG